MQQRTREQRGTSHGKLLLLAGLVLALLSLAIAACSDSNNNTNKKTPAARTTAAKTSASTATSSVACSPAGSASSLTGSGSTFDGPLFTKWNAEYKTKCNVEVNYQAIGSGGGITAITDKTVDYAASDAIMNAEQTTKAESAGGPVLHIPVTMGGIAVVVNLPNIKNGQLKLTPDVLAKIYLGDIKKWNDAAIAADNSGLSLPSTDIAVVHRSDGSGTTFIFTDYLSKVSPDWKAGPGSGTTVNWPAGLGGEKNAGVAASVSGLPGAIGYVEVTYAVQNPSNLAWAAIQNKAGKFIEPTLAAISAAAEGVTLPDDMKVLIDNSDNANAYPISGFSWILAYKNQTDQAKAQTLANYIWWGIHDGQGFSEALTYAKLPAGVVSKAEAQINSMTVNNGQPITFK